MYLDTRGVRGVRVPREDMHESNNFYNLTLLRAIQDGR